LISQIRQLFKFFKKRKIDIGMKLSSKYLIKELLGNGLFSFITLTISFMFNLYIARVLDIRDYGTYELELTIGTLFGLFIAFSTDGYASKMFSKKKKELIVFNQVLSTKLFLFTISLFFIIIFKPSILLPFTAICISTINLGWLYEIRKQNSYFSKILVLEKIIFVTFGLTLVLFFSKTKESIFTALLIANSLSILFQYYLNKNLLKQYQISILNKQDLYSCIFLLLTSIFEYINGGISKFFIEETLNLESVAIYSLALKILILGTVFQSQVVKIFRPLFFQNKKNPFNLYFIFTTLPTLLLAILIYFLFPFYVGFFSKDYSTLIDFALPCALFFIIINLRSLFNILYTKYEKLNISLYIVIFTGILKLSFLSFVKLTSSLMLFYSLLTLETIGILTLFIWITKNEKSLFN
jgi:O-antigen/teichoic acid export membrane protein